MSAQNRGRGFWTVRAGRRIYDVVGAKVIERRRGNCVLRYLVGWLSGARTRFEACLGVARQWRTFYLPHIPRFLSPSTASTATG
jgi:hypothetical protein